MKLNRISPRRFVAGLVPLIMAFAVACGSTASALDNRPSVVQTALESPPQAALSAAAAAQPSVAEARDSSSAASSEELDADAIVAAEEMVLNRIYEGALPSVVHITVEQKVSGQGNTPPFGFRRSPGELPEFRKRAEGSGFVWSDQGHIVTNHHVIADADRVMVVFADGTEVEAKVLGSDPDADLAVLKVDMPSGNLRALESGDSDKVKVGQLAVAIGNPFGQDFTMTSGIVSAVGRTIRSGNSQFSVPEVIQTDAPINPGNSGGPLLDRQGRVIGINTQIISESGSSSGIGFAVPINIARRVVPALIAGGSYEYSWLGISAATLPRESAIEMGLPEDTHGALVMETTRGGPADLAGLRGSDTTQRAGGREAPVGGDVIVAVNGAPVKGMDDVIAYLSMNTRPGDKVTLDVIRKGGESAKIEVTLGSRPR